MTYSVFLDSVPSLDSAERYEPSDSQNQLLLMTISELANTSEEEMLIDNYHKMIETVQLDMTGRIREIYLAKRIRVQGTSRKIVLRFIRAAKSNAIQRLNRKTVI